MTRRTLPRNLFFEVMGACSLKTLSHHGFNFANNQIIKADPCFGPFWKKFEDIVFRQARLLELHTLQFVMLQHCREALLSSFQAIPVQTGPIEVIQKECLELGFSPPMSSDANAVLWQQCDEVHSDWQQLKADEIPSLLREIQACPLYYETSQGILDSLCSCLSAIVDAFSGDLLTFIRSWICFPKETEFTRTKWDLSPSGIAALERLTHAFEKTYKKHIQTLQLERFQHRYTCEMDEMDEKSK